MLIISKRTYAIECWNEKGIIITRITRSYSYMRVYWGNRFFFFFFLLCPKIHPSVYIPKKAQFILILIKRKKIQKKRYCLLEDIFPLLSFSSGLFLKKESCRIDVRLGKNANEITESKAKKKDWSWTCLNIRRNGIENVS